MCYCSFPSSSCQSRSPLLPQHHHDDKSASSAVVDLTTTNDPPPPPPPSPAPDDSLPASVDPNNKTESEVHICLAALLVFLVVLIVIGLPAMCITYGQLRPYSPQADVVSAFVSVSSNTNSSGLTGGTAGRLLTTNWVIVLHLKNYVGDCCPSLHLYRIQASIFHADGRRPLASTGQFTTLNIDNAVRDGHDMTFSIQFKAEGVDVGKHVDVVAGIPRDYGTQPTLRRFKVVILVWARLKPEAFPARYYLARISCDPFWIGSSNIGISTISSNHKDCHTHVIRQSKPSFLDENRANIKDQKIN